MSQTEYPVHVLFLEPDQSRDHWLNRLSASVGRSLHGRGFCHVEISMPNLSRSSAASAGGYLSSSIYNGETVKVVCTKTFANPGYVVHTISMKKGQLQRLADFVYDCQGRNVGFDGLGMYLATLPFQLKAAGRYTTFCSRFVVEALQAAGGVDGVEGLNASITSPSRLYKALRGVSTLPVGSVGHEIQPARASEAAPPGTAAAAGDRCSMHVRHIPGIVDTVSHKLDNLKRYASFGVHKGYSLVATGQPPMAQHPPSGALLVSRW